jgi:hypothetical protein
VEKYQKAFLDFFSVTLPLVLETMHVTFTVSSDISSTDKESKTNNYNKTAGSDCRRQDKKDEVLQHLLGCLE